MIRSYDSYEPVAFVSDLLQNCVHSDNAGHGDDTKLISPVLSSNAWTQLLLMCEAICTARSAYFRLAFRFGLRLFLWTFLRRLVVNLVRSLSLALKQTRVA